MFDHHIQRYSIADQRAVHRWFIISGIVITAIAVVLLMSVLIQSHDERVPNTVHRESDIKQLEQQLKNMREQQGFIEQIKSKNQQQLKMLEQLALCIPDQVCLSEAKINHAHVCLKGESYTYNALFEYQKALETQAAMKFVIRSMDKQQELISFVLETR